VAIEKYATQPRQLAALLSCDTIHDGGAGEKDQTPLRKKSIAVQRLAPALPHRSQRALQRLKTIQARQAQETAQATNKTDRKTHLLTSIPRWSIAAAP
jgi:hypothetical protein